MRSSLLVVFVAFALAACSKDPQPDLLTARGGIPDDSVKPAAAPTGMVARTGIPDDSIKPVAPVVVKPVLAPKPLAPAPVPTPR